MPLAAAYTRLTEAFPALRVTEEAPRSGGGWTSGYELAAGGPTLDAYLTWDEEQLRRDHGEHVRPDVIAGFGLHRYAWPVCLLFTVPWFLHSRVPRLPVTDVSLHRADGRLTVRPRGFACLQDDPASALPGARVVADAEALRAELRAAVAEHLAPVLDAFRPRMRRGRRAMWGMATDEVTEGLWRIGALLGMEDRVVSQLGALLPGFTAPYAGAAAFRTLGTAQVPGGSVPTRDRISCCLFYTLCPAEPCATCPRTPDADRVQRLAEAV